MLFTFLLVVQSIVAAAMVGVILMQRSEGGGLGVGGSPSGLMSARGAADFLTRATTILATLFVVLSIALAGLATVQQAPVTIDPNAAAPARPVPVQPQAPPVADPLGDAARKAPAPTPSNGAVPLAQ
jgi:preprotein translocase subunit SecG